ncbi:hypothetical protein HDU78_004858 [Chytriomyces hyalinus]|nr:hypothetical protein HDU78_004858 [Chytriomyces hyalinus]
MRPTNVCIAGLSMLGLASASQTSLSKFIIVFKDSALAPQITAVTDKIHEWGGRVVDRFTIINAVSAEIPAKLAGTLSAAFDQVDYIEADGEVHTVDDAL